MCVCLFEPIKVPLYNKALFSNYRSCRTILSPYSHSILCIDFAIDHYLAYSYIASSPLHFYNISRETDRSTIQIHKYGIVCAAGTTDGATGLQEQQLVVPTAPEIEGRWQRTMAWAAVDSAEAAYDAKHPSTRIPSRGSGHGRGIPDSKSEGSSEKVHYSSIEVLQCILVYCRSVSYIGELL